MPLRISDVILLRRAQLLFMCFQCMPYRVFKEMSTLLYIFFSLLLELLHAVSYICWYMATCIISTVTIFTWDSIVCHILFRTLPSCDSCFTVPILWQRRDSWDSTARHSITGTSSGTTARHSITGTSSDTTARHSITGTSSDDMDSLFNLDVYRAAFLCILLAAGKSTSWVNR